MSGFQKISFIVALLLMAGAAHADVYLAPFDRATWEVRQSPVSCRLQQTVPKYGDVVFETPAGGPQVFYADVDRNPMRAGPGKWVASAPSWNPDRPAQPLLGAVVTEGRQPILLADYEADRLLQALRDGMMPELVPLGGDDGAEPVRLGLSPINFQGAYDKYQRCAAQLLPYSVEQMANTSIQFARDRSDLDDAARRKIDLLLRYVKAGRGSPRFEIDVLSDDTYRRVENLELSKLRAQVVNDYLVGRGIAPEAIVTHKRSVRGGSDLSRRSVTILWRRSSAARGEKMAAAGD